MHIDIHYLPSLEFFTLALNFNQIEFEVMENFPKQTFRNRTYLLGANGIEMLTIPVVHVSGQKIRTKDVKIDYSQDWIRRHIGAISSAYGKAPYFEHFEPFILKMFAKKNKFLVDLNIDTFEFALKILDHPMEIKLTNEFNNHSGLTYWNQIAVKKDWQKREIYVLNAYRQCFGDEFIPNLSILDLLMNHGRDSKNILRTKV